MRSIRDIMQESINREKLIVQRRAGDASLISSRDSNKNEIIELFGDRFVFLRMDKIVDDYIKTSRLGDYEINIWQLSGQPWQESKVFAEIIPIKNNTDTTMCFTKRNKSWHIVLKTKSRYSSIDHIKIIQ